jgi:hypothetical protein
MLDRGLDVIGMAKSDKKRYLVNGCLLSLQELYFKALPAQGKNKSILRSILTELTPGIPVTIVFVRHRSKKKEWLAILSTDSTLS